jgi:hypothetical protein
MWPFRKRHELSLASLDDPVFGRTSFEGGIWEAVPADWDNGFVIWIDADEQGPSDIQRDFFRQLRPLLADLHRRATDFVKATEQTAILENLKIYSVGIGGDGECRSGAFEMEFCDDEASTIHRVEFSNYIPIRYGEDD